jgi:ribosome-binding protein aMBF1 (putative translation factor)
MDICFRCGISGEKSLLYDAITSEGVQKICRKCSHKESVPLASNKDALELKEFERKQDIYERISRVSGIANNKKLNYDSFVLESQDSGLKDLVEKNVCKGLNKEAKPRADLIRNFHWLIKRYRRLKHLTTKQFAEALGEPEKVIILAEQGVVSEGYDLIRKMERCLGISLIKEELQEKVKEKEAKDELKFDNFNSQNLTIADLRRLREEKKSSFISNSLEEEPEFKLEQTGGIVLEDNLGEDLIYLSQESEVKESFNYKDMKKKILGELKGGSEKEKGPRPSEKDLSQSEIDDLIFGRK